jgi:hypothetical protein
MVGSEQGIPQKLGPRCERGLGGMWEVCAGTWLKMGCSKTKQKANKRRKKRKKDVLICNISYFPRGSIPM